MVFKGISAQLGRVAWLALCGLLLLSTLGARGVVAQSIASAAPDSSKALPDSRLFHRSDLYVLAGFGAATVAMFPLDRHLASVIRDERLIANKDLRRAASAFRFFGGSGPFIIGGSMYVVGRAARVPRMADLAVHGTEAVVVGIGTSVVLKTILGRGRPYISADTNPTNFKLGRGFRSTSYQSFPSGHSTAAFSPASRPCVSITRMRAIASTAGCWAVVATRTFT